MRLALDLADRALTAAEQADGTLALVSRERSLLQRFAANRPTQATIIDDDVTIELATLREGHIGRAATNRVDPPALAELARRSAAAADAALRAAGPATFGGFPAPGEGRPHHGHDAETAALDPAVGGKALAAAFAAATEAGIEAHGVWTTAEVESAVAVAGSGGIEETVTDAFMKVVCIDQSRGRSGYAAAAATAAHDVAPANLAATAVEKATVAGEPVSLPPGEYPVVFEPHAVGLLLELLGYCAFDGLAHAEGRGALAGRLGTRVASTAINLSDSPFFPTTLPRAFDAEGVAKAPLPLIQDGVARAVVHDLRSAELAGASPTGHALVPGGGAGPLPTNLVLAGGGAADEAELCSSIDRGIYVTRLWYANVVRPRETLVTAVTRDGTFLIEDGRVTRPLVDLRLTDTVLGLLSRVEALSAAPRLTTEGEFYGRRHAAGTVAPAARIAAVNFTS